MGFRRRPSSGADVLEARAGHHVEHRIVGADPTRRACAAQTRERRRGRGFGEDPREASQIADRVENFLIFGLLYIGLSLLIGLVLAILLDQKIRAEGVLRTIYLYPMALSFIALKCPNCGWDLPVSQFDVIHFCKTCHRAWIEREGRFRPVKYQIAAPTHETDKELIYLPFWVCRTQVGMAGQVLKTAGEMKPFTGLPGFPAKPLPEDSEPFRFFVPALRIRNILAADKLAAGLTRQQPVYRHGAVVRLEEMNSLGVFLPPQTAAEMTDLLLCSLVPAGNRLGQDRIQNAATYVRAIHLLLWPFYGQRLFLRDAICGLGIQKGTLGLSQ